jgi:hypothetical protein
MVKHHPGGMEKLTLEADSFPAICASILAVAAHRMPDRGHMRADLMRAARLEAHP